MKADPKGVLTGSHYMDGDQACAEGALAAGCRFIAGYPITPSTEVAERFARRIPQIGGVFIQMEDEIASMAAVLGAVWGGTKAMTVTSGPGLSLMMENIGLAMMLTWWPRWTRLRASSWWRVPPGSSRAAKDWWMRSICMGQGVGKIKLLLNFTSF